MIDLWREGATQISRTDAQVNYADQLTDKEISSLGLVTDEMLEAAGM